MTYYKGVTVTFNHGIHDEAIERVVSAIRLFEFVADVSPVEEDVADQMNKKLVKYEMVNEILELIKKWDK